LTATPYLDTAAIATLLEAATLASKRGVPLGVIGVGGEARVVAEATELDRIFLALGYEVQFTGLATAVRATVDRLVTDMELELGRGAAPRDVR
jgi:anti-anti-sigma regulatory factor